MPDLTPVTEKALYDLIFAGRKIDAIKLVRDEQELGLKEAKDFVEDLERELRAESPGKFLKPAGNSGCMSVMALAMLAIAAILMS